MWASSTFPYGWNKFTVCINQVVEKKTGKTRISQKLTWSILKVKSDNFKENIKNVLLWGNINHHLKKLAPENKGDTEGCSTTEASSLPVKSNLCLHFVPTLYPERHPVHTSVCPFLFWLSFSRSGAIQRGKSDYIIPVCAGPKPPALKPQLENCHLLISFCTTHACNFISLILYKFV